MNKALPTKIITIIAYVIAFALLLVLGIFLKNGVLAAFLSSCVLVVRGVISCATHEERHLAFAFVEGFALFVLIRIMPLFFV